MKLSMEINLKNKEISEKIFKALKPDIKGEKEKISYIDDKIIYEIESENFSHILAACTSILKLINEVLKMESQLKEKNLKE